MERCDYCAYRNSWECGDGWTRRRNYIFCDDFELDFDTLTEKQKKAIQKILMENGED